MDDKVLVRLRHGYYNGGITPLPDVCPTIDAHIACWHILIGEKMKNEEIKCECIGMLGGEKYEKMHDIARRVYDTNGIAPTQHTCGGGNLETKIVEQNRFFEQAFETAQENDCDYGDTIDAFNKKVNKSGVSPTVTTRPEGFKTAILAVDGFNQSIRADQTCFGTITRNAGADLKRNGQGIIEIVSEPLALDEQNGYIRQDGLVGTLTTDGSSPKHNNRIVEPNGVHPYELSDAMKKYIVSKDDKYRVSNGNLKVNRDIACSKTTREGCTRADASDYISPDLMPNENIANKNLLNYRIRKLTPKECGRLMGVRDDDIDKMSVNQSNSSLYHLFGDSIVVDVLMAIFKQML